MYWSEIFRWFFVICVYLVEELCFQGEEELFVHVDHMRILDHGIDYYYYLKSNL